MVIGGDPPPPPPDEVMLIPPPVPLNLMDPPDPFVTMAIISPMNSLNAVQQIINITNELMNLP
jgi:hypothetical protein